MKKKYIVLDILSLLFLAGAYITRHFADRKIGFVRWLNFNGDKFRESFPTETVKYAAAAAAVILMLWALHRLYRCRQKLTVPDKTAAVLMLAITAYYMYATHTIVYSVTPSSFLLVPLIGLSAFLIILSNILRSAELAKAD